MFAIIVFGSIASEEMYSNGTCPLDNDSAACGFGIAIGVIAFLDCLAFLAVDAKFDSLSSVKVRRRLVVGDMIFSGAWAVIWFLTFCYLTNEWRQTSEEVEEQASAHLVRLAIAFSFFSIFTWVRISISMI